MFAENLPSVCIISYFFSLVNCFLRVFPSCVQHYPPSQGRARKRGCGTLVTAQISKKLWEYRLCAQLNLFCGRNTMSQNASHAAATPFNASKLR